jgi:hypothetical protein
LVKIIAPHRAATPVHPSGEKKAGRFCEPAAGAGLVSRGLGRSGFAAKNQ